MTETLQWLENFKNGAQEFLAHLADKFRAAQSKLPGGGRDPYRAKVASKKLEELRVAAVMDQECVENFKPECELLELTPGNWKAEIESFQPDLVLIESALEGKDSLWAGKISQISSEYLQMAQFCHRKDIPLVFWNKEDNAWGNTFMPVAKCADFVFTTDIDRIGQYRKALGHEKVYFLPLAVQPLLYNPVEEFERKDKFCIAGGNWSSNPERKEVFDELCEASSRLKGLDIYEINNSSSFPNCPFPKKYVANIAGGLNPNQIGITYKKYRYGIGMNSNTQSQTVCGSGALDMLASNTVAIGNYSRGLRNLLGDLTICTDDPGTLEKEFQLRCGDLETLRKYRLLGLRKVLSEHLYEDRLAYIAKKVFGNELRDPPPQLIWIASPDAEKLPYVLHTFKKQTYLNKKLVLVGDFQNVPNDADIVRIDKQQAKTTCINDIFSKGYFGLLKEANHYGENYLTDLALTFRYMNADGVGKAAHFRLQSAGFEIIDRDSSYRRAKELKLDRAIFSIGKFGDEISLGAIIEKPSLTGGNFFATDEFNFCENHPHASCAHVDDLPVRDQGLPLATIQKLAEDVSAYGKMAVSIAWQELLEICLKFNQPLVKINSTNHSVRIASEMAGDTYRYLWLPEYYDLDKLQENNQVGVQYLGKEGNLDIKGAGVFYTAEKERVGRPVFPRLNELYRYRIPEDARYLRLALKFTGSGTSEIEEIVVGESRNLRLPTFISKSNILVLTDQYPSCDDLYRNMFVHKRVEKYKEAGLPVEVMRMHPHASFKFREFSGIDVVEGQEGTLRSLLDSGQIDTVCVHFLNASMWNVLKKFKDVRIIVWLHGAEIQPWYRRTFNYSTREEEEKARLASRVRENFWRDVFAEASLRNMHFVFVSQYFADEVFADYHLKLPEDSYRVIHNCIDGNMFSYEKKPVELRKRILSIRPYASRKYANDLTVKCIEELSKKEFFDDLYFHIVGDGKIFDEVTASLKKYPNVHLQKEFLKQDEIATLHKEYGIFMIPTRSDTQGVSRDEAMASGLVPVTNSVAAVPEFVDESCAILAPAGDYNAMAKGVEDLYYHPEKFERMSRNAAVRVRRQSSENRTISREIKLILNAEGENYRYHSK